MLIARKIFSSPAGEHKAKIPLDMLRRALQRPGAVDALRQRCARAGRQRGVALRAFLFGAVETAPFQRACVSKGPGSLRWERTWPSRFFGLQSCQGQDGR